jgi:MSHA biogenesis protein MshJ
VKLPDTVPNAAAKFNGLSLRERALVALAILAVIIVAWDNMLMGPLQARESTLTQEMQAMQESMTALSGSIRGDAADPTSEALKQEQAVQTALASVDEKLASAASGLIAPERMIEVINDVLSRQRGVRLVSLRNKPVETLLNGSDGSKPDSTTLDQGPYVHPIELTIEGSYLDVLAYLKELETLPWRIYWKALEMETLDHPTNRVRIELRTLSMDKAWIGV